MTPDRPLMAELTTWRGHYECAFVEIDDRGWVNATARRFVETGPRGAERRSYAPSPAWVRMSWPKREVREIRWLEHEGTP